MKRQKNAGTWDSLLAAVGLKAKGAVGLTPKEAIKLTEGFHGRPVGETFTTVTPIKFHNELAVLGELEELGFVTANGGILELPFKRNRHSGGKDNCVLVCASSRTQIEFAEGNQKITFTRQAVKSLGLGSWDLNKQYIDVGEVAYIAYWTDKHHLTGPKYQKDGAPYEHWFGKQIKRSKRPRLTYDVLNEHITLVGGSYTIRDEGIFN